MKTTLLLAWTLSAFILLGSLLEGGRAEASSSTSPAVNAQSIHRTGCPYLERLRTAAAAGCPRGERTDPARAACPYLEEKAQRGECPYSGGKTVKPRAIGAQRNV